MPVPHGWLAILSLLYLASILTFVMALNEQDTWPRIWAETRRRWLKLLGILAIIAAITLAMTLLSGML